jgi:hypothetical protein
VLSPGDRRELKGVALVVVLMAGFLAPYISIHALVPTGGWRADDAQSFLIVAAQVMPILLLAFAVEQRLMTVFYRLGRRSGLFLGLSIVLSVMAAEGFALAGVVDSNRAAEFVPTVAGVLVGALMLTVVGAAVARWSASPLPAHERLAAAAQEVKRAGERPTRTDAS